MRAMAVRRYWASRQVIELQQVPEPQPQAGGALIRVRAIGVNFADLLQRMGLYPGMPKPPFIPGIEIAGVVEKIVSGAGIGGGSPLRPGDAVRQTELHAYAEWVAMPAEHAYRLPQGMTFEDARRTIQLII